MELNHQLIFDGLVVAAIAILGWQTFSTHRAFHLLRRMFILHMMGDTRFENKVKDTNRKFKDRFAEHGVNITNLD